MQDDLQINITAIDDASGTLESVAGSAEKMAQTINEAAATIEESLTTSLTAAEIAAIDSSVAASTAWMGAADDIDGATTYMGDAISETFSEVSINADKAAFAASEAMTASFDEIGKLGAMTAAEVDADFASMGGAAEASAEKVKTSGTNIMGYFRYMIAGMMFEQIGKTVTGGIEAIVAAASGGDPAKITQMQDQLATLQAQLQKESIPISGHGKTKDVLHADQAQQAAQIKTTTDNITALQAQLQPLVAAQERAGQSAIAYDNAVKSLTQDWQTFLATVGAPLLSNLTQSIQWIDKVVISLTSWAKEHPAINRDVLEFVGTLGGLVEAIGAVTLAIAFLSLIMTPELGMFLLISTSLAVVVALFTTFHTQLASLFNDLNAKTGILDAFKASWKQISDTFTENLLPALKQLWEALKPLMPYLADLAKLGLAVVVVGLKTLIDEVTTGVTEFTNFLTVLTKIGTYLADHLKPILDSIKDGLHSISSMMPSGSGGAASSIGSGFLKSAMSQVPFMADGGIVSSPTLAMIGESGPEAVIPLSSFNNGLSLAGAGSSQANAGGNVTINIGTLYGTSDSVARQFSADIGKLINQQLKLRLH